jgi:hypothetical protein
MIPENPMPNAAMIFFLAFILIAPVAHATTSLSGEAVVRSISPEKIAVLIDTTGDQMIDHGFLLSVDLPAAPLSERFPTATVQFKDGYVRVISAARVYDLQVAGYPDPPPADSGSRVVTLIGYSLINSSGDSGCDVQSAFERDAGICFSYGRD